MQRLAKATLLVLKNIGEVDNLKIMETIDEEWAHG